MQINAKITVTQKGAKSTEKRSITEAKIRSNMHSILPRSKFGR